MRSCWCLRCVLIKYIYLRGSECVFRFTDDSLRARRTAEPYTMRTEHELAWNLCKCKLVRVADTLDRLRWQYLMRFIYASNVLLCIWNSYASDFGLRTGSAEARCTLCHGRTPSRTVGLCVWRNTPINILITLMQRHVRETRTLDGDVTLNHTRYHRHRAHNAFHCLKI